MSSPVLSPRAKAFTVRNLLRLDRQGEQKPVPVPAQLVRELPYDAAPGWTDVSRKTDCRQEPAVRLQPHAGRETWCTCHDVECMSLCRHPSVITTVGEKVLFNHVNSRPPPPPPPPSEKKKSAAYSPSSFLLTGRWLPNTEKKNLMTLVTVHTAPDWLPAHTAESFTQRPQLTGLT